MNISILIEVDGEQLALNEELNSTIGEIVNAYIKQKISGVKVKKPNGNLGPKQPKLTNEQIEEMAVMAKKLEGETKSGMARQLSGYFGRSVNTVYTNLTRLEKAGRISFQKFDRAEHMRDRMSDARNAFQRK